VLAVLAVLVTVLVTGGALAVAVIDAELLEALVLPVALLHGFQVVTTHPAAVPVVELAVLVTGVEVLALLVTDAELLAAAAPKATRHTLPVTPALRHAAVSLTNKRYSVAETLTLVIAPKHSPNNNPPTGIWRFLKFDVILNLLVIQKFPGSSMA
jgi:hypothetical protein